ncbi:MAG: hypothetical protein DRP81_07370, partial [Candidatus Omnitrophota bacterium]
QIKKKRKINKSNRGGKNIVKIYFKINLLARLNWYPKSAFAFWMISHWRDKKLKIILSKGSKSSIFDINDKN